MKYNSIEELVFEYLETTTTVERKNEIENQLSLLGFDINELKELTDLDAQLNNIPEPIPAETLDNKFYKMLQENSKGIELISLVKKVFGKRFDINIFPKFAYSFVLLIIGWFIGFQLTPNPRYENHIAELNSNITEMKEVVMLSMLNRSSPMERIKAVNYVNDFKSIDAKIATALLATLNTDENVNVRLVTVEALAEFADNADVRAGLIKSITQQESPMVQIALADLMLKLGEKRAVENLEQLLKKKELNYSVRDKIERTIQLL